MDEQMKAAEELRIAEFNSLQAQINPHFLYNTMDMINWMALQGQTSEISSAVQSLYQFYKPVSYTHLDVYKRQPLPRWHCFLPHK